MGEKNVVVLSPLEAKVYEELFSKAETVEGIDSYRISVNLEALCREKAIDLGINDPDQAANTCATSLRFVKRLVRRWQDSKACGGPTEALSPKPTDEDNLYLVEIADDYIVQEERKTMRKQERSSVEIDAEVLKTIIDLPKGRKGQITSLAAKVGEVTGLDKGTVLRSASRLRRQGKLMSEGLRSAAVWWIPKVAAEAQSTGPIQVTELADLLEKEILAQIAVIDVEIESVLASIRPLLERKQALEKVLDEYLQSRERALAALER